MYIYQNIELLKCRIYLRRLHGGGMGEEFVVPDFKLTKVHPVSHKNI